MEVQMSGIDSTGGGNPPPQGNCQSLVIDTQISSPKAAVIAGISVGDLLDVALDKGSDIVVVVVLFKGKVAGGIAAPLLPRLRECMEQGVAYSARVTARHDALVRVRIAAV
jgi:hypothetical protein